VLLEFFLGMQISRGDRFGRFPEVVEMTQLVRNARQGARYGVADGMLPIGDHPDDGDIPLPTDARCLLQERYQIVFRGSQEAARHQHLSRATVAQHPQHFMPHIRLQPIECQYHLLLFFQSLLQPLRICQVQGQQLFIAVKLIGHGALCHHESSSH